MPRSQLVRLQRFAAMLGWRSLREWTHVVKDDEGSPSAGSVIRWYESGSMERMFLQINEAPCYQASVYAMRYRLCTGWHAFTLHGDARRMAEEAAKLEPWLHHRWFTTIEKRREFRRLHPECCNYTWRRLRQSGPPYEYVWSSSEHPRCPGWLKS